jgi:hypothetical protein
MKHKISELDGQFLIEFQNCATALSSFDHGAHLRLAYIYLCRGSVDWAYEQLRSSLLRYLEYNSIGPLKYSVTITRAWTMVVYHFMQHAELCGSAEELVIQFPQLLDGNIMLSHYSKERLFSIEARDHFMQPDVQAIPEYAA